MGVMTTTATTQMMMTVMGILFSRASITVSGCVVTGSTARKNGVVDIGILIGWSHRHRVVLSLYLWMECMTVEL